MRSFVILLILITLANDGFGQESFKKKFSIPKHITLIGNDTIFLVKDSIVFFENLSKTEKEELKIMYPYGNTTITTEESLGDRKVKITKNVEIDKAFYQKLYKQQQVIIKKEGIKGFVKFEDDGKIFVNPYLTNDSVNKYDNQGIYYYQLKNRQSIKLWFQEFSVSTLIIPIKYRFRGKNNLSEEFSTSINGNIFIGYSFGQTSFLHQQKVGNKSNNWKISGGFILGASAIELNQSNTSKATVPLPKEITIKKGLGTVGIGIGVAFNKVNFGLFGGRDYAIGDESDKWNYNKKPWVGLAFGYSLLSF